MVRRYKFHITEDALCLNFANTLSWRRSASPIERIENIDDLVSWARQAGLISARAEQQARRQAVTQGAQGSRLLREARRLRETTFAVFAALAERRPVEADDLADLNHWIRDAIRRSELIEGDRRYQWQATHATDPIGGVLDAVVLSAEALLRSTDVGRIGECSGRDCRWLWVDRTRNRSRRWCDMAVCGNRTKVRRHYHRSRRVRTVSAKAD